MIREEICTYEVCKLAKDKGFDWMPSMYFHSGVESDLRVVGVNGANPNKIPHSPHISCPTQSLLQRWLREEKGYYVYPFFDNESRMWIWVWVCLELTGDKCIQLLDFEGRYFDTYEFALEDALKYALENLV